MTDSAVWFVTGASSGLGRAVVHAALAVGDRVVATARDVDDLADLAAPAPGALARIRLDVTDPAQVRAAVQEAIDRMGRIDVLVNNAGHGLLGAVEELSDEDVAALFETNVFGALRVTREVLPHMRRRRRGHVIQMSSVGGVVANPGHGLYGSTKFALEGWSEALAGEVEPLGIRTTIIEPGPFRTDFAGRSVRSADPIEAYRDTPAGRLRERFGEQDGAQPNDPVRAAQAIVHVVRAPAPPLRLPLGPEAVRRIREKLGRQLEELAEWESLALDTRFAAIEGHQPQ